MASPCSSIMYCRAWLTSSPFSIGSVAFQALQRAAGVRFELVHDSLGSRLGLHNGMHVVGPYVRSQQIPTAKRAVPPDGRQYYCPARFVEHIGILEHFSPFCHDAL